MRTDGYLELKSLTKRFSGNTTAVNNVSLCVRRGQFISLLGPSGCGKTTTMRMIAGLEMPTEGEIWIDGKLMSGAGQNVLPERRQIGMVFQSYAVWPHMKVFDNVAYGLRMKKTPAHEVSAKVQTALEMVGLRDLGTRYPMQLSGGQQQRVAIARALVVEPSILLLDEPLSNLDEKLREEMRFELKRLQRRTGVTTLYVTHSQQEALVMSDAIGIMKDGVIQQFDLPEKIYSEPSTRFVAGFIGLANFIPGTVKEIEGENGIVSIGVDQHIHGQLIDCCSVGETVSVMIRPEHITLTQSMGEMPDHPNRLQGVVKRIAFTGNIVDYFVELPGVDELLRVQTFPPKRCSEGEAVLIDLASGTIRIYQDGDGARRNGQ